MHETPLNPVDFWPFTKACQGLAHVKPRKTLALINEAIMNAVLANSEIADVSGKQIPITDLDELFCRNVSGGYGGAVVSPAGAALMIRIYGQNLLVLNAGKRPGEVHPDLLAYSRSEPALRARERERQARSQAYTDRLTHLDSFAENEFNHALLDEIFWANLGKGRGSLVIGGITVEKQLHPYASNSRKSTSFSVGFTWQGADGEPKSVTKDSQFAGNRRNDSERNWGLGRQRS